MGVDLALDAGAADVKERLLTHSRDGFDIVVEASGSHAGAELAWGLVRQTPTMARGQYVREPISLCSGNWPRLVFQANYLTRQSLRPGEM